MLVPHAKLREVTSLSLPCSPFIRLAIENPFSEDRRATECHREGHAGVVIKAVREVQTAECGRDFANFATFACLGEYL
jgi:hypothetical protein